MCVAIGNEDEISMEEFVFLFVVGHKWMESSTAVVPVKGLGSILANKSTCNYLKSLRL